jgi:hypothetical protein
MTATTGEFYFTFRVTDTTVSCKTRGIRATRSTNTSQTGLGVFRSVLDNHAIYLPDPNTVGLGKIARVVSVHILSLYPLYIFNAR